MSIRPVNFNEDGSINVVYDELGHSGTILAEDVRWATNPDETDNHNYINLVCPDGCGSMSTHPVAGGAAPLEVQQMFVLKEQQEIVAAGAGRSAKTMTDAAEIVKQRAIEMDGEACWKLDDAALAALEARGG